MPLSDTKLRSAKPAEKPYKLGDSDGLYAYVAASGRISFRYDYRLHGRRETVTYGRYPDVSLAEARELHRGARRLVAAGKSPANEKQLAKEEHAKAETLKEFAALWLNENQVSEGWRTCQLQWLERDVYPKIGALKLREIEPRDILNLVDDIKNRRNAPHSAFRVRGILNQIFDYAVARQATTYNPVKAIPARIIVKPQARTRVLAPSEIRNFIEKLDTTGTTPTVKILFRLLFLTMVRVSELRSARWNEFDLDRAIWEIPAEKMKMKRPHIVFLSRQATALLRELRALTGRSEQCFPGRTSTRMPVGKPTLNSVLYALEERAERTGEAWEHFTIHDIRRTVATMLHEAGWSSDVVEKALAHEVGKSKSAIPYNRAEYSEQRKAMMQALADMLDEISPKLARPPLSPLFLSR
ncbi:tyrosine-type recombinase/integrase [Niveibacterium microcysteis]|uniref:Tyrosine-type recombinase/integrase n=1 Tax=Niveibacterium microcysteis TaxID=2811415 RepID=A0ABX7MAM8_9RHOO|nr:tyrosine-type recombinase/integrase [Niveibacterium microcysteis]QSI78787.1 tyrosine-type recombinase/integrase [Niveibacterium microcysteis]